MSNKYKSNIRLEDRAAFAWVYFLFSLSLFGWPFVIYYVDSMIMIVKLGFMSMILGGWSIIYAIKKPNDNEG